MVELDESETRKVSVGGEEWSLPRNTRTNDQSCLGGNAAREYLNSNDKVRHLYLPNKSMAETQFKEGFSYGLFSITEPYVELNMSNYIDFANERKIKRTIEIICAGGAPELCAALSENLKDFDRPKTWHQSGSGQVGPFALVAMEISLWMRDTADRELRDRADTVADAYKYFILRKS
ncbi:uncharacterized protein MCYG_03198 [Microsporum canis CBS 113480]|uniref:Uncharacterized protein n=1 Tax=Arthroderma otae (strain ATCC MYA-4605 / CBS 113480) TaxID=554155 RepID=C5FL07_ARTOC|nr:uncharacterized protein MCYG_03198 [Microsporum canis CBS 113480]EEQ30379.1 predicted protein [Microsporum canis CBS 113480]